jgi:hypothetical protein
VATFFWDLGKSERVGVDFEKFEFKGRDYVSNV